MKRYLCSLVALGLLVGVTGQAMAQPSYSFTILDVPGSSKASAVALGINASGQIVGSYYDAAYIHHGFLYDQGGYTTLDVPGSNYTHASGINDSGQIVGYYFAGTEVHLRGHRGGADGAHDPPLPFLRRLHLHLLSLKGGKAFSQVLSDGKNIGFTNDGDVRPTYHNRLHVRRNFQPRSLRF